MSRFRVGRSWGKTIVEEREDGDHLMGLACSPEDAQKIVDALNKAEDRK